MLFYGCDHDINEFAPRPNVAASAEAMAFEMWIDALDERLMEYYGLRSYQIDHNWSGDYEKGLTPYEAAAEFVQEYGEDRDQFNRLLLPSL